MTLFRTDPALRDGTLLGTVEFIEKPFGNVITDIPAALIREAGFRIGGSLSVEIGSLSLTLPYHRTFGDVGPGEELSLLSSRGKLSFSINQGDFSRRHGVVSGEPVKVTVLPR